MLVVGWDMPVRTGRMVAGNLLLLVAFGVDGPSDGNMFSSATFSLAGRHRHLQSKSPHPRQGQWVGVDGGLPFAAITMHDGMKRYSAVS